MVLRVYMYIDPLVCDIPSNTYAALHASYRVVYVFAL